VTLGHLAGSVAATAFRAGRQIGHAELAVVSCSWLALPVARQVIDRGLVQQRPAADDRAGRTHTLSWGGGPASLSR
jgi:hypothetical protein